MDIGIFVVIMIVLYVVPELLKRFRKKPQYKYPEFPTAPSEDVRIPGTLSRGMKPPVLPAEMSGEGMPGDEGDPSWVVHTESAQAGARGLVEEREVYPALDTAMAAQGLVWAELLAKPVSMRPMQHGARRL